MSSHNHVKICNQISLIAGPFLGPELCTMGRTVYRVRNMVLYRGFVFIVQPGHFLIVLPWAKILLSVLLKWSQ